MAAQEGFRRVNRLSVYLVYCSFVGLTIWFIQFFVSGRWGLGELTFLVSAPLVAALSLRIISWVLEGFWQNPQDSREPSGLDQ